MMEIFFIASPIIAIETVVSNPDLLTEILLCVPAKSLIRFKCVSKHWQRLISDSHFSHNHTRRNPKTLSTGVYFCFDKFSSIDKLHSVSFPDFQRMPNMSFLDSVVVDGAKNQIIHSCNGLLLCRNGYDYIVCNPTTKKHRVLPKYTGFDNDSRIHDLFTVTLAFDPLKSHHYQVVLAYFRYDDINRTTSCRINIYESETLLWHHVNEYVEAPTSVGKIYNHTVFWREQIHWLSQHGYHIWLDLKARKLTASKMPQEPRILPECNIRYYGVCHGHFFLIQTRFSNAKGFRILQMNENNCSWTCKWEADLKDLLLDFADLQIHGFYVLSIVKEIKRRKDLSLVLLLGGKVIYYNIRRKIWKELCDFQMGQSSSTEKGYYAYTCPFIETLEPV